MALLLSNYTAALREVILPYIQDNLPSATILLDQMKREASYSEMNNSFITPVRTGRHGGVANLSNEGNNVVASSGATTSRGTVGVKIMTGNFEIGKLAMDATKSSKTAIQSSLQMQADSLVKDFSRSANRQFFSDGVGVVAEVSGSASATIVSVVYPTASMDDGRSIDWYGTVNNDISATKYLAVDQILGFGTAGLDLGTVTSVNGGTSVTVTGAPGHATNDAVFITDGAGDSLAGTAEIQGFRLALSSTTGTSLYAGLARNTAGWTPQFGSVLESLTLSRMQDSYIGAQEYAQVGDKYCIFVNKKLMTKYGNILMSMKRATNREKLLGGWPGLAFEMGMGEVGVYLDYDVPDGEVLIVNMDTWKICQVSDVDWMNGSDESSLLRLQSTLKYEATMHWFLNLMCISPAANGRETQKKG